MLSDEVRSVLFSRPDLKAKRAGERIHFRCLRHEDSTPSAWMAGGAHGCFACGFTEPITTLAEILGIPLKESNGYTLADYATDKRYPLSALQAFGLSTDSYNGRDVVAIPYFATDGKLLRRRFRDSSGKWWEGRNLPIYLYGLDRLPDVKKGSPIIVVEGESDCHAAWLHGLNAVGVPGASTWKREWKEFLDGLEVYVWEEPDQGGPELVKRIVADFPKAKIIQPAGVKDLADLHRAKGEAFPDALRALMASAVPTGQAKPAVAFDVLLGDRLSALIESKSQPIDAVPMPWPTWNRMCRGAGGRRGIARGWHVIAAARTGAGKSILALNVAVSAIRCGERVGFISLEMSQEEVETRLLAIASGIDVTRLEQGDYLDIPSIKSAGTYLASQYERSGGCLYTNREPIHKLQDVLSSMRHLHEVHGCRFFVVDYLQLAGNPLKPETIVAVSNAVRRMTMDLRVATLGLSQFNRQTSVSKERPSKEGLMGGSALENDAVQVLLIDHSQMKKVGDNLYHTNVIVDKNRHGPTTASGTDVPIEFNTKTLRMTERCDDEGD